MKLAILQENLEKSIALASRFTSSRTQLPILGNILLRASKTKLLIASTNLEISVSDAIGAKVEEEGEIAVPSKTFSELVSNLPKETVNLKSEKEQLNISTSSFSSTVLGMNTSDFPKIPASVNKEKSISLPKTIFSNALSKVLFAVSSDETRPILTGVLFTFNKEGLTLVATDGFRLSLVKTNQLMNKSTNYQFVVPRTILFEIGRVSEDEILLEFREKDKQVVFGVGDTVFSSRLLEGTFPDWEKIIPKTSSYKVTVDKEDLLRAVKLASIFARDNANIVKLIIDKEQVIIKAEKVLILSLPKDLSKSLSITNSSRIS
ncbi:MAG: polymerase III subunit beta protein [Candidatus Woesebacteria bacterium GW2011_GWB1_41_10]|uniref:Polymerase III subunit beta protein n=1 Tax=Candidatus Woesebacteria bacterium GW2011_GWB1_41_10 TaxID=1618577 RepID=A0A0G0WRU2_9BACT|nr:MAG: polymerase III subunit beta protein [Candidatus Woesebacteria bacterium GW2011_GWB1_41_10]